MKQYLYDLVQQVEALNTAQLAIHIIMAVLLGFVIYVSYYVAHAGTVYSRKFNVSLVVLTVLTSTVMTVIGNNIALSLGMVGALSIVRFRTAIKDSRETVYIFWCIAVGIACGVGDFAVAGIGSAAVFIVLLILGRVKNENRVLLVVRSARSAENAVKSAVSGYYDRHVSLQVENTTRDSAELIYELSRKWMKRKENELKSITDVLYEIEQVEYVNVVSQDRLGGRGKGERRWEKSGYWPCAPRLRLQRRASWYRRAFSPGCRIPISGTCSTSGSSPPRRMWTALPASIPTPPPKQATRWTRRSCRPICPCWKSTPGDRRFRERRIMRRESRTPRTRFQTPVKPQSAAA